MGAKSSRMKHQRKRRRKARSLKRQEGDLDGDLDAFRERLQREGDCYFVPPEEVKALSKLSEAVLEVGEPLLNEASSREQFEQAIMLTVMAWNFSLMDPGDVTDALGRAIEKTNSDFDDAYAFVQLLGALIDRKLELYPDDDRMIIDYEVNVNKRGPNLLVAYALTPEDIDELKRPRLRVVK